MEEKLIVLRDESGLQELKNYLSSSDYIAFDTETTGVDKGSKIIGFSFSADTDKAYYAILSYWDLESQSLKDTPLAKHAKNLVSYLVGKNLIMHNAVFDCWMVENNYQVKLIKYVHTDTMILAHLLDESRHNGLKELGVSIFGEDAKLEQTLMKESVTKNGGVLTKAKYELYKADAELIGRYGAKDTILTLKLFYHLVPQLEEEGLFDFFYKDESMRLLRGPTYHLNTSGLMVDLDALKKLKGELEAECMELKAFIYRQITPHVQDKYPGTSPTKTFNIGSGKQLAWLLFERLGNEFHTVTKEGRNLCKALGLKLPYNAKAKRELIRLVKESKGKIYEASKFNPKTKKMSRPKKVGDIWNYLGADKAVLALFSKKYEWVAKLLEYSKSLKLLTTYVEGIEERIQYGIIRPSFLQHGTTSGRYSCKNPNFQNLPRKDKRVKGCIIARPGNVFVGADQSQLEPRVFASYSQDERLLACFESGDDFYSVIGAEVFDKYDCSMKKDEAGSFAEKYPDYRDASKVVALSATYGTTAPKMAPALGKSMQEAQEIIDNYFERFPSVHKFMLETHKEVMSAGRVTSIFGRPRRMEAATKIPRAFPNVEHAKLPYEFRKFLNLGVNHKIQSTGASIMNRGAIGVTDDIEALAAQDPRWEKVRVISQIHDELILEGPEALKDDMAAILKDRMENTVELPGVKLIAEPKIAYNLKDLK